MNLKELYPAFEAASQAMALLYDPVFEEYSSRFDLTVQEMGILTAIPTFEPKPVSAEILNIRSPYTAPTLYQSILQRLSRAGMIEPVNVGQYLMTHDGLEILKEVIGAAYTAMAGIQSLSITKMMDLASRLKELSDACLAAPDPPGVWCIQHVRRMDPGSGAPMMVRIDQFLSELRSFRDDAHLAAWRGYESNGHAWDILTYLWVARDGTLETVSQALKRRGNSAEQTQAAVDLLARKGWIKEEDSTLHITPVGSEIRKTAEAATDRFYLEPFKIFSETELEQTLDLIEEHRRGLPVT